MRQDDPPLVLLNFPTDHGPLDLIFRTRYDEREFEVAIPRELWVEARGEAPSLEDGITAAWAASATVLPIIALTTNVAIGELQPHLAFETTEGIEDRAFFQSTVETERGIPPPGRRIPVQATVAVLDAMKTTGRANVRDATRLLRAANQYLLGLRYYKRNFELLCVSHIFMAAEALKVAALRRALSDSGLSESELAETWGVRPAEPRTRPLLEAEARRRIVFDGNDETHRQAAEISDGFEHGFRDLGELHGPSLEIRNQAASLVRGAWLHLVRAPEEVCRELTEGRFAQPLDMTDYVRYMRGRLVGPGDDLAPENEEYPYLEWRTAPKLADAGDGRFTISGEETFTVRTNDRIAFQAVSWEFWGPQMDERTTEEPT